MSFLHKFKQSISKFAKVDISIFDTEYICSFRHRSFAIGPSWRSAGRPLGFAGAQAALRNGIPHAPGIASLPMLFSEPASPEMKKESLVPDAPWMSSWIRQYYGNDSLLMHQDVLHALNPKKWGLVKKNAGVPPVSFSGIDDESKALTYTMQLEDDNRQEGQVTLPLSFDYN